MNTWRETLKVKSWKLPPPLPEGFSADDKAKINDIIAYEVAGKCFMELFEKLPGEINDYVTPQNPNIEHMSPQYITAKLKQYLHTFVDDITEENLFAEGEGE